MQALRDLRQGFATVLASPWPSISILIFGLTNITLAGPYGVAMPFLVSDSIKAKVGTLGLLYFVFPRGYIIGGVGLGRYARIRRRGLLMYGATALEARLLGVCGRLSPLWVLVVAALVNGAALEAGHLIWANSLQTLAPNDPLGRMVSIDSLGSFRLLPIGLALVGWATATLGPPAVFISGGTFTRVVPLAALAHPAIRRLDSMAGGGNNHGPHSPASFRYRASRRLLLRPIRFRHYSRDALGGLCQRRGLSPSLGPQQLELARSGASPSRVGRLGVVCHPGAERGRAGRSG
jgi:hypothetical protein